MARVMGMTALAAALEARGSRTDGAPMAVGTGVFRREGDYWSIAFEGDAVRMKHSKGLGYLATLLRQPGQEVHALDLAGEGGNGIAASPASDGLRIEADAGTGPALDRVAKAAYRERVEELRADVAEAEAWNDPERTARAAAELERADGAAGIGHGPGRT